MAKRPKHGFNDYVKNPDLFRKETRENQDAELAAPTPQQLAELVAAIRVRPLSYEERQAIQRAGDAAVPLLQTALRDETFQSHRYGKDVLAGSPLETALDLLEPFALPAASVLEPALRHDDDSIRSYALYHLARCGNDDAIDALKAGLRSESEKCRTWTLMGLEFLKRSGRGSKTFRAALFDAALPLIEDVDYSPAEHAPRALLVLDFERAKGILLGKNVLRPEAKWINYILRALRDEKVAVPVGELRDLLAAIKNKATKYPFDYTYAEGLMLLAMAEGAKATDLIADAMKWGNDRVREGAAEANQIAAGVANPYAVVIDVYRREGAKGLSQPQLYYLTLFFLDAEVQNGGFSQFYFNSSGDLAPHAVAAARAVGAAKIADLVQKANGLFGKPGPSADRNERMDQLSKVDLQALNELDTQFYKCPERLSELLPKFVASHADSFKPAK